MPSTGTLTDLRAGPMQLLEVQQGRDKVLHLDQGNPKYKLGREWIESSHGKKDLEVLIDEKLNATGQHVLTAQQAKRVLGCVSWPESQGRLF